MARRFTVSAMSAPPMGERRVETVERKGLGHPDTICDAVMESVSVALAKAYIEAAGTLLHYNVDKGLLVAGESTPALAGGVMDSKMRLVLSGRAAMEHENTSIPVAEIAEAAAADWIASHLRFVDPKEHVTFQPEIKRGSPELVDSFARGEWLANDTSAVVGFAPLSETERLVLEAERFLNSPDFKARFPEAGEDVKVMGTRDHRQLELTVAIAFVDRFVATEKAYYERKEAIRAALDQHLRGMLEEIDTVSIALNNLDDPERGLGGMYLTVLGTSAEGADGGEVGRGNRVNGLICLNRPSGSEAAAGKNPVSHVGKVYNVLSHQMARGIYESVEPVQEVSVWLGSQIGRPVNDPWHLSTEISLTGNISVSDVEQEVLEVIESELAGLPDLSQRLIRGEIPVC